MYGAMINPIDWFPGTITVADAHRAIEEQAKRMTEKGYEGDIDFYDPLAFEESVLRARLVFEKMSGEDVSPESIYYASIPNLVGEDYPIQVFWWKGYENGTVYLASDDKQILEAYDGIGIKEMPDLESHNGAKHGHYLQLLKHSKN
jgi:hypothetical protein